MLSDRFSILSRPLAGIGLLLIATDLAFGLLAIGFHEGVLHDVGLSLELEGGHAEFYQYVKECWIVLCCGYLLARTRQPVYSALALTFAYVLADDALAIHERVGEELAPSLHVALPLDATPQALGEVLFFVAVGLGLLLVGTVTYYLSDAPSRRTARFAVMGLGLLAFFGVFVDALHQTLLSVNAVRFVLEVLEDGGELVAMSFITTGAIAAVYRWWPFEAGARAAPA
jgi:hypothetical protein